MPRFREQSQTLLRTPEFVDLFTSADSPVHAEIERLIRLSQDTRITDEGRMLSIKWKLEGMRFVERLVREAAAASDEAPMTEAPTRGARLMESVRLRTGRYALLRGLTG